MNVENLKEMYNHILLNVPEERLDMWAYRLNCSWATPECNSVGCIIGHCTALANNLQDYMEEDEIEGPRIKFYQWSIDFLGIPTDDYHDSLWNFMFSSLWSDFKYKNSSDHKSQCLARMKFVIEGFFTKSFCSYWDNLVGCYNYRVSRSTHPKCFEFEPYKVENHG